MYCWSLAWRILSITFLACEVSTTVWQFVHILVLPFFGIGMKTDLSQYGYCWVLQICWHTECSTLTASSFRIWKSRAGIPSLPLALCVVMVPKVYLTSHFRMSGSKWMVTPSWLSRSLWPFSYRSSVRSLPFLSFYVTIFAWNVPFVSPIFLKRSPVSPICFPLFLCTVHLSRLSFFLIFIFTLFYFTILYWFCHTLTRIHHGCTWVPKHEPPSRLPPHIISLGHPRAPAPSILYLASNMDWWFVSYMIVYMFQCHSPKSSHPLPQGPKVRSTHLCLFCCLTYRVIITIFLNSIYMC